jgi:cytochrome c-type biogenesis protein CcmH
MLRLAIRLKGALPFSLGEKVADAVGRMRVPGSEKRALRANPHPYPSPVGEGDATSTTQSRVAPLSRGKVLFFLLPLVASLAGPALAVQPDEVMKDPALETRARALSGELRCLVCQNESIDDSEAPLARDIRVLIRERIGKGESNDAVRAYLVSRYGDFILLKPPFKPETLLLWLSPVLTLGLGAAAALYARRRAPRSTPALSAEEEARLAALTGNDAREPHGFAT